MNKIKTQDKALILGALSLIAFSIFLLLSNFYPGKAIMIMIGGFFLLVSLVTSVLGIVFSLKTIKTIHKIKGVIAILFSSIFPLFIITIIIIAALNYDKFFA
ncbi:hypothetical protein [Aquimarina algiphila]|uniref:hypothetical protein n=1 Tax=Aquimarina algiphila TaxID=2047982 RepID=UPI00232FFC00|nr:hypothetical protein [Aquimarina algiphila]